MEAAVLWLLEIFSRSRILPRVITSLRSFSFLMYWYHSTRVQSKGLILRVVSRSSPANPSDKERTKRWMTSAVILSLPAKQDSQWFCLHASLRSFSFFFDSSALLQPIRCSFFASVSVPTRTRGTGHVGHSPWTMDFFGNINVRAMSVT